MKLTKETLKRIIKEELQATLREGSWSDDSPWNDQLGGKIGNPYGGDKVSLVRSLNNAIYSLDQGYDQEEIDAGKETLARVKEEMSPEDFEIARKLADLFVHYSEYATRADVEQTKSEMAALCAKLGITLDDII